MRRTQHVKSSRQRQIIQDRTRNMSGPPNSTKSFRIAFRSGSHAPAWEQVRTLQRHETSSRCGILAAGAATTTFPGWSVGTSQRNQTQRRQLAPWAGSILRAGSKSGSGSQLESKLRSRSRFRVWRIPVHLSTWLMRFTKCQHIMICVDWRSFAAKKEFPMEEPRRCYR